MKLKQILNIFILTILLISYSLTFGSVKTQAQGLDLPGEDIICGGPCPLISGNFRFDRDGITIFLVSISRFLTIVGVGLAVLFLVWSGVLYITGKDDQAKKGILNAIIGLLIIVLAYTVVTVLIGLLTGTSVNVGNF